MAPDEIDDPVGAELGVVRYAALADSVGEGRAVFSDTLSRRAPAPPSAGRDRVARSALVAPIVIGGKTAGNVGLIDRIGGFSRDDHRLAKLLAELPAEEIQTGLGRTGKLLAEEGRIENEADQGSCLLEGLRHIRSDSTREVRCRGLMLAVEFFAEVGGAGDQPRSGGLGSGAD